MPRMGLLLGVVMTGRAIGWTEWEALKGVLGPLLTGVDVRVILAGVLVATVVAGVGLFVAIVLVAGSAMRALDEERGSER